MFNRAALAAGTQSEPSYILADDFSMHIVDDMV